MTFFQQGFLSETVKYLVRLVEGSNFLQRQQGKRDTKNAACQRVGTSTVDYRGQ